MMKVLQHPATWIAALVLGTIGVAVALYLSRRWASESHGNSDGKTPMGFKEAVKQPEEWQQQMEDEDRAFQRWLAAAKSWDDGEVTKAVRHFVFDVPSKREAWRDYQVLLALGTRTHATLTDILREESLRTRLVKPTGEDLVPEAPFNRICQSFGETPPLDVAPLLVPFLQDQSKEIRKDAALCLGKVGSNSIIEPIRKALSDQDEYVRSYALMGLEYANNNNRLGDRCRRELFEDVLRLLKAGENADHASRVLLFFDRGKAIEAFLSKELFHADAKALHQILQIMVELGVEVPRDRLLNLIRSLDERKIEYPHEFQLDYAFRALGKHRVPEDRLIFERFLSHPEKYVAEGAAEGMLASHGISGYYARIWKKVEEKGIDSLTTEQRQYHAVFSLDAEVCNGGLTQYFFNSSGDDWKSALAGLEAIGSKERLAILRQAIAKFGPEGPSVVRDQRASQLSKLVSSADKLFDDLDSRYYKSQEVVNVLIMRFVLKNPNSFR